MAPPSIVFLRQYIRLRRLTETELAFENIKQVTLDRDDALGRGDLATKRRFLNGCRHHIAGEGKIGRLELEQLLLGDAIKVLDGLTPTLQNPLLP